MSTKLLDSRTWENWCTITDLVKKWNVGKRRAQQIINDFIVDEKYIIEKCLMIDSFQYGKPIYRMKRR